MRRPQLFKQRILIIDDDDRYDDFIFTQLLIEGYEVSLVNDTLEAEAIMEHGPLPDLILSGLHFPAGNAWFSETHMQKSQVYEIPMVMLDMKPDYDDKAICLGYYFIPKFPPEKLLKLIPCILSIERAKSRPVESSVSTQVEMA